MVVVQMLIFQMWVLHYGNFGSDFVMTCKGGALVIFCNRQLGFLQPLELITDAQDELRRFPVNHMIVVFWERQQRIIDA